MHPSVQRALRLKPKQTGVYATEQGWVVEHTKTGYKELLVSFPKLKTHLHNEGILHEHVQAEVKVETPVVEETEQEQIQEETPIQEESDVEESTEEESEVKADKPKRGRKPKVQE